MRTSIYIPPFTFIGMAQYKTYDFMMQLKMIQQQQLHILHRLQFLEGYYPQPNNQKMHTSNTTRNGSFVTTPVYYSTSPLPSNNMQGSDIISTAPHQSLVTCAGNTNVLSEANSRPSSVGTSTSTMKSKPAATLASKENVLPEIDYGSLISPEQVVEKYPRLLKTSKIPTLAVKLAREAYFGPSIMMKCTVRGTSGLPALPEKQLTNLKQFLYKLSVPRFVSSKVEFENVWKSSIESVGQACKNYR